jgi:hypothetical protein
LDKRKSSQWQNIEEKRDLMKIERESYHTTFDKELRKEVSKTAIDLGIEANQVLEIAYVYFKTNCNIEEARRILKERNVINDQ